MQPSLFNSDGVPPWPEATCGKCVHRNARSRLQPLGFCVFLGQRHTDEAPCSQWFGLGQLIEATGRQKL